MADTFIFKPIRELAELIAGREVSPVGLTQAFLDRLEQYGPHYNALVTLTADRALATARQAEADIAAGRSRGLLHGIPWGAKDLLATGGGIPTTWGAAPFRDQQFDHDATVVARLEAAGAPLAGKLAMIELAGGMGYIHPDASLTGPPRNPWDTGRWTGGSSSGSGAAVAAGLVPFAIGSETWGSILIPANNCGLAGLRPTYGRVSRHGAMALCWTLDKLGPLCLTADDCGIVLEAISGPDPQDDSTHSEAFVYNPDFSPGRRYRIGVPRGALDEASDAVRENFEAAIEVLRDVADVEEMAFPEFPYVEVTSVILMVESASAFEDFLAEGGPRELSAPGLARSQSLRPPGGAGHRLHQGAAPARGDGSPGGRNNGRVRCHRRAHGHEHRHAYRPGVPQPLHDLRRGRRPDGQHRQRLRPALHFRPQRLRRRRPAHGHPVHGPRL